jgi:hypothetical protein
MGLTRFFLFNPLRIPRVPICLLQNQLSFICVPSTWRWQTLGPPVSAPSRTYCPSAGHIDADSGRDSESSQQFRFHGWRHRSAVLQFFRLGTPGPLDRLRKSIREEHAGEVPIGCAVVVPTDHDRIPLLVSAPTMRVPGDISDTVNVYLAFRAALLAVRSSTRIKSLLSPALGTGIGGMSARRAAKQMHAAYVDVVLGEHGWRSTARGVLTHHAKLFAD